MLCMHWLILRREMQYMPTLKVKSSFLKLVWPELSLQMCDLILKGDMQEMTTSDMQ